MKNDFWWNYSKKCYELLPEMPSQDREAILYLPQDHFAEQIYYKLRSNGFDIQEAMKFVLSLY